MDNTARAAALPQVDASSLVDAGELEAKVREMYGHVAREEHAALHFEVGRPVCRAPRLPERRCSTRSRRRRWRRSRASATSSTSRRSRPATRCSTWAPAPAPTCSAPPSRSARRARRGVDFTREQVAKATRLRDRDGFAHVAFTEGRIDDLPFADASFDAVISNGVINLSVVKSRVFAEAARVLRPGGRLALADIVSGKPLKERTRRNVDLWAACIAGAIPRTDYVDAVEAAGFAVRSVRRNDYAFVSDRALEACSTYAVESISLLAERV